MEDCAPLSLRKMNDRNFENHERAVEEFESFFLLYSLSLDCYFCFPFKA
jgi:hypothetical protein